ncbi:MAG TPA: LysM peptidoglycan-binding domain-containing protein, partial [Prosthecobacter sp.]
VQPGNTLLGIATKHDTTVDSIVRMNGLMSTMLQPGDHLTIIPMDFHLVVDVSSKEIILMRKVGEKQYPFKFYQAKDIRLPPGTRVPLETKLAGKNASIDGKTVPSTDSNYAAAEKWISAQKPGIVIRTPPEPHVPKALPVESATGSNKDKGKKSGKTAKGRSPDPMPPPPPSVDSETGIFLPREDIEEIFALVRTGSTLSFKR